MQPQDCNAASSDRTEAGADPEVRSRKLALDNEDLRFECARLQASLHKAQHEIMALTERNTDLQRRLDRIHRLAPRGSTRLLRMVTSLLRRH